MAARAATSRDEVFNQEIDVTGAPEDDETIPILHLEISRDFGADMAAARFELQESGFSAEVDTVKT